MCLITLQGSGDLDGQKRGVWLPKFWVAAIKQIERTDFWGGGGKIDNIDSYSIGLNFSEK